MKKLQLLLAFVFSAICVKSFAYSTQHSCFDIYVPEFKGGFKFSGGMLYLKPSTYEMDYSVTINLGTLEFNSLTDNYGNWSYEVGIGYDFPCTGNDMRLNYSHLSQTNSASMQGGNLLASSLTDIPISLMLTDVVTATGEATLPVTATSHSLINEDALDRIDANSSVTENKLDLEVSQSIHITPYFRLRFYTGLRSAELNTKFGTLLSIDSRANRQVTLSGVAQDPVFPGELVSFGEVVDLTNVHLTFHQDFTQRSHFTGFGPRFGLDANYYLDIGISFFASSSTAMLAGEENSSVTEIAEASFSGIVDDINFINPDPELILTPGLEPGQFITQETTNSRSKHQPSSTRIIPNLEARLGISYAPCLPCTCSKVFVEAGYMVNHYFNASDRLTDISSNPSLSTRHSLNVAFDGLYLKVEMHI